MLQYRIGPFLVLLLLGFIWGSSFILMKKGIVALNTFQLASFRLFFAGLVSLPVLVIHRKKIVAKDWIMLAIAGILGNGIPAYLFAYALQTGLESSIVGGLNATTPLFSFVIGLIFFGILSDKRQIIGLILGFIGSLFIIIYKTGITFEGFSLLPFIAILLACIFYGININILKYKLGHIHPLLTGLIPLALLTFPATIILSFSDVFSLFDGDQHPFLWNSIGAILVLGVIGSSVALYIFNILLQKTDAIFSSSVNYLLPFVAIIWGVLDHEEFKWVEEGGALLCILMGIYLTRKRSK
jgi:drug/metabolite transporter (DMT)-like permease